MDKRFINLFNLTEDQAIALLDTPQDQLDEEDSRYIAASHLVNFPTDKTIAALVRAIQTTDPQLDNRIVRRKSVETLGRLEAAVALPVIQACLNDPDCYTVENAVWAIGEIGTQDATILEAMAALLDRPGQTYRVIIHTLTKLDYQPALERIRKFVDGDDKPIASAAMAAVCRLTGDDSGMAQVVEFLQHENVYTRRLCIQDLIDAKYYSAIPAIAKAPVSLVFRLRGVRLLAEAGMPSAITWDDVRPSLEAVLRDHPADLEMVHEYDQPPGLDFVIRELYETDFGRSYLATQTMLESYPDVAPAAIMATYEAEGYADYGAHYHVMKLLGWLKYAPATEMLMEMLNHPQPQFQKSRAAAAIALGEIGDPRAIEPLKACLSARIWDLKYASLLSLEKLGDTSGFALVAEDADWAVRAKAQTYLANHGGR
jgi:bilin biosynthesis protein